MRRPGFLIAGYTALGAVVAGPLLRPGLLLAVDAAPTPFARLDPAYWGLGQGTHDGTVSRLPLDAALAAVALLTSTATAQKLVLVAVIALAGMGMHRLVDSRLPVARVFAGLLYAVNPFVYERIWTGQLFIVLGYALIPWGFGAFRRILRDEGGSPWTFAALAVATGVASAHMALLLGLLCSCALVASAVAGRRSRVDRSVPSRAEPVGARPSRARPTSVTTLALGALALAALGCAWWLLPTPGVSELWSHVGRAQLAYYASVPMAHIGLIPTLAALSGYWNDTRPEISYQPAWPALALTLVALAAAGGWLRRRDPMTWAVAGAGLAGFLLALGYAWTPTRAPFVWLMAEVPPLRSFRESGKGLALVAFAYSYLGCIAVEDIVTEARRVRHARAGWAAGVGIATLMLAVPLALGARELWGAWGQLQTSSYPASWSQADHYLSRVARGSRTLVLPFHGYFSLSFAHGRVVANPAASYFQTPVLVGRSVGGPEDVSDPEQTAVQALLASQPKSADFADCLAALGVGRVLVLHQADWAAYGDIGERPGMSIERSWPGVTLYQSNRPTSLVMARTGAGHGCRDWTPVPARIDGLTSVRLLARPPAGAALRVELPNSSQWVRAGARELSFAGWGVYRRNYIVGLILFVLLFAWPTGRTGLRIVRRTHKAPSGVNSTVAFKGCELA